MSTHKSTWKRSESKAAAIFGARRQPLSGSSGRDDVTSSDSTHPALFIEAKYRERHAVRSLHDATKALARREGKTPVLMLADKGRPGLLIVAHEDDMADVVTAWLAAREPAELEVIEARVRRAFLRSRGELADDAGE